MKKLSIALTLILIFLTACNKISNYNDYLNNTSNISNTSSVKITGDNNMDNTVTKDWIKSQFDLTDDELTGINVEEVANALWWTQEEVIKEYENNPKLLLSVMTSTQRQLNALQSNNASESTYGVLSNDICQGDLPDFTNLSKVEFVAFTQGEGMVEMISGLLDVAHNKIFYLHGSDVSEIIGTDSAAAKKIEEYSLSDSEVEEIISSINKTYLIEHDAKEVWTVTFEYNDGSVYERSIKDANLDEQKFSMITTFFEKMSDKSNGAGFFKIWPKN